MLSGDRDVVLAQDAGFAGMLGKPVEPTKLVATIARHVRCHGSRPPIPAGVPQRTHAWKSA
jgi:DNA-binding response OmpR family regulator